MENQKFETETFSLLIPSVYTNMQVVWESIRAAHELPKSDYLSYATTTLIPVAFFNEFTGETLVLRYWESCKHEDQETKLLEEKEIQVAGHTSNIQMLKSNDGLFYYYAIVQISDEFCYIFKGDCKIKNRDFYEPLFEEIWKSLEYFGNPKEAINKLPQFLLDLYYHTESDKNLDFDDEEEDDDLKNNDEESE